MTRQAFLLDSNAPVYADFIATLKTYTDAAAGFSTTQVIRDAAHNSTFKLVFANVTEEEIDADEELEDARAMNYPNELVRHRWKSLESFRVSGFHVLGESERSYIGVAGRDYRFVGPQMSVSASGANYGAGDGKTHNDCLNGWEDATISITTDYFACRGADVAYQKTGVLFSNGQLAVADATGDPSHKINFIADPDYPGMIWGSFMRDRQLPWELFDAANDIYVCGDHQSTAPGFRVASQTSCLPEADVEDITLDATTLIKRHVLKGHTAFANLNGATGRGRFYVPVANPSRQDPVAVLYEDGAGNWTDYTAEATSVGGNDVEAMPAGAADGAAFYVVYSAPFSQFWYDNAQNRAGTATVQWQYSREADWAAPTNINDPQSGFATGWAFDLTVHLNPKIDWAPVTLASGEAFEATGYALRLVKTGGTVTTAARIERVQVAQVQTFMHRWDDSAPTRGVCLASAGSIGSVGTRFVLNDKGNVEFIRFRMICPAQDTMWATATDTITLSGAQFALLGGLRYSSGTPKFTFRAAQWGTQWWSVADHYHQDKNDPFIQDILAQVAYAMEPENLALDNHRGGTLADDLAEAGVDPAEYLTAADDMPDWSDILYTSSGPYRSGSALWSPFIFDGCKLRGVGAYVATMNDPEAIDLESADKHALAWYGGFDAAALGCIFKRIGFENHTLACDYYTPADETLNHPVGTSTQNQIGIKMIFGYNSGWNGKEDSGQPLGGIKFESNNKRMFDDNGTGDTRDNWVWFWGFKDLTDGGGLSTTSMERPDGLRARCLVFDNCGGGWGTVGGIGSFSTNAITFDGVSAYNNISANLLSGSGGTPTPLYPTGAAGESLILGVVNFSERRWIFTITTPGVGNPTLSFKYWNGSTLADLSNVSDGTSGFTATGTLQFDRPTDIVPLDIGGIKTIYPVFVTIESGSFSTVPQASKIQGRTTGSSINVQHYVLKNHIPGSRVGATLQGTTGTDAGVVTDDYGVIYLSEGEDVETAGLFRISSVGKTFAQWQANVKLAINTDAEIDGVYGPNHTVVPFE